MSQSAKYTKSLGSPMRPAENGSHEYYKNSERIGTYKNFLHLVPFCHSQHIYIDVRREGMTEQHGLSGRKYEFLEHLSMEDLEYLLRLSSDSV